MSTTRTLDTLAPNVPPLARVFLSLLARIRHGQVLLVTPSGEQLAFGDTQGSPRARLMVHDWRACGSILKSGDIGFADAWRKGWVSSPDLSALLRLAIRNEDALSRTVHGSPLARLWFGLLHRLRRNTRAGSRRNIHAHYDIGNAFYGLWLDSTWTYSSALFHGDYAISLECAQGRKYQHIIDLLGLEPGMRVLEIGCGWGGFAAHAARQGIAVEGITISRAQAEFAERRLEREGLQNLASVRLCDYRDVQGTYDAIVSIEMFEAVGESFWNGYFRTVHDRLRPGGKAVIQTITIEDSRFDAYRRSSDFIRQYIFPGGMLPGPQRFIAAAGRQGLSAEVKVGFGKDYAETLRRWSRAFEDNLPAVRRQGYDEDFIRLWFLYLAYCEAGFDEGRTDVVQFLLQRED